MMLVGLPLVSPTWRQTLINSLPWPALIPAATCASSCIAVPATSSGSSSSGLIKISNNPALLWSGPWHSPKCRAWLLVALRLGQLQVSLYGCSLSPLKKGSARLATSINQLSRFIASYLFVEPIHRRGQAPYYRGADTAPVFGIFGTHSANLP